MASTLPNDDLKASVHCLAVIASFPLWRRQHCGLDGKAVKRTGSEPNWFQEEKTSAGSAYSNQAV
jgi:hypothetical protein